MADRQEATTRVYRRLGLILVALCCLASMIDLTTAKIMNFNDPNTGYVYQVASYNVTQMTTETKHHSILKVSRVKYDPEKRAAVGRPENVQTITLHSTLVDFDINFASQHCYLVAITSRTRRNVELYSWKRTQFDNIAKRDSFARPHSVRLFRIQSAFYIAIAQDQLQLMPYGLLQQYNDYEEPSRFIGCAVLKFVRGQETSIKYHQFIRLPYHPHHVDHFISNNGINNKKPTYDHYLVFSLDRNVPALGSNQASTFQWSPLNEYFWPYRMPRDVSAVAAGPPRSHSIYPTLVFPSQSMRPLNWTQMRLQNTVEPVESCFNQLQRLLTNRELQARKLIDTSRSLWRTTQSPQFRSSGNMTNISARVIVNGNVIVRGSLIESPQITLFGQQGGNTSEHVINIVDAHSPSIVEHNLKQAFFKLRHIRDKLSRAVLANYPPESISPFNSRISFFGNLRANHVIFKHHGISNSNVRLNGLPFRQLEHELVSLRGQQDIQARVVFRGKVTADFLEIHGQVNRAYHFKDALDITSKRIQVIDGVAHGGGPQVPALDFASISTPQLVLSHNATFNKIRLDEFVTKDDRTQVIFGRKTFRQLSMAQLVLANHNVRLNGQNITHVAKNSIRLRDLTSAMKQIQFMRGNHVTFTKPVTVNQLTINGLIDGHLNISTLIHDSVKTHDASPQQIAGHKHFLNGLRIARLTTEGAINGIHMDQVFNLNPPKADYNRFSNGTTHNVPISGRFTFLGPVVIGGNLNADSINSVNIKERAVRRTPQHTKQLVFGAKRFARPLIRVTNSLRMLDPMRLEPHNGSNVSSGYEPRINGLDIRRINAGLQQQMQNPLPIFVEHLEITGNLNLPIMNNNNMSGAPRTIMGNFTVCPLDLIRSKLVLGGGLEEQLIDRPIRVNSLRAKSISLEPGALNGYSFPEDFVVATSVNGNQRIESVYGHKTFEHLSIEPPYSLQANLRHDHINLINLGFASSINNISYNELQTFIDHERQRNSTGETVYQTLNVHGNIYAKRINGYLWPDDIPLKSYGSSRGPANAPLFHRRIYSPLVFLNSSNLEIENQLVLRGPIQLTGFMNGVNLTEFARQSVTYGDKELFSAARPIKNKVFLGGITVTGELRSQGLIEGVNIDEMSQRVVTIGPSGKKQQVISQKVFMSDTTFQAPVTLVYMNELPIYNYLKRVSLLPGNHIQVLGKKTVTGALLINKNLIVQGKINGIDFADLHARAISLAPGKDVQFNKTLTIEGDVFMDNLLVDEETGTIDGIKLSDMVPIRPDQKKVAQKLVARRPASIQYERPHRVKRYTLDADSYTDSNVKTQLDFLRRQIVSLNLLKLSSKDEFVAGFIEIASNELGNLFLPEQPDPHSGHEISSRSFLLLDQVDFHYSPTIYRMSVGISTDNRGQNVTSVFSSVGASDRQQLSVLPVESPNSAMFLTRRYGRGLQSLFLLISQDYTTFAYNGAGAQCPRFVSSLPSCMNDHSYGQADSRPLIGSIHVYLFQALQNSSSLSNAYFDLYQTLDLPAVDSFESFEYQGSPYALAVSRPTSRIYLLVLRGYSGFQIVSYMNVPLVESVKILYTASHKPALLVYQTNGMHRLMDSVII